MWVQIGNWLYQNAMAIFISAIASLLISKRYYDKANRESVLMMVIFPIVKLLNEKYYTRNDYETLFEINSSYAVKYLRKKERNKLLELLSAYFLHVESFRQRVAAWMRSLLVWVADLKCIQK